MKNINNSWKLDIPELGTVKVNISAKDFEKIGYFTYVNETNQLPTYLSVKKEKKKNNNQTISNIKSFQKQFNSMYDYIPNKAEIIKNKKINIFSYLKRQIKLQLKRFENPFQN